MVLCNLSEHEYDLLIEAKERQIQDLKERPIYILTEGVLVSYNHNKDTEPMIEEIVMRYNKKEYTFKISDISIKDKP